MNNINYIDKNIIISGDFEDILCICEPIYMQDNNEIKIQNVNILNDRIIYYNNIFEVDSSIEESKNGLYKFTRKWKNISNSEQEFVSVFRISPRFDVEKYLIPCVNFNGNNFGSGNEPKGLTCNNKKWIFSYKRESIPSCTITENSNYCISLFSSLLNDQTLESSCSIWQDYDNYYYQEILHPEIESPLTYTSRDIYSDETNNKIKLSPGYIFTEVEYVNISIPRWRNFGIANTIDFFLDNITISSIQKSNNDDLWNKSISFSKSLLHNYNGMKGFMIGFLPNKDRGFAYRQDDFIELGWCGQNILLSRMLIEDYKRNRNYDSLVLGIKVLDDRIKNGTCENGLLLPQLKYYKNKTAAVYDTCNMGYGCYELLRVYESLNDIGIKKVKYFNAAIKLCNFFVNHYSDSYGFGKSYNYYGECIDKGGSIGVFAVMALAKAYKMTRNYKYLKYADKALQFYVDRDLNSFKCTAGALDTCCVDKETSAPFIMSSVLLYELTLDNKYLTIAEKATYYFSSWMYFYNPIYNINSDFIKYNLSTIGMTAVSTQHHHLDMYACVIVPYLIKMADYTGNNQWGKLALLMWNASIQCIGTGNKIIRNRLRPVGSQNEAYFHCNWGFNGFKEGDFNDWLVAWPCAFRLSTLCELPKLKNNKHYNIV